MSMMICLLTATGAAFLPTPPTPLSLRARVVVHRISTLVVAQLDGLPAGWTTGFDEANQATYYINEQTGQSQWEPPVAVAADSISQQVAQQNDAQQELPVGWTMGFDSSCGSYYYFNAQTGQSQWEAPHFVAQQEPAEQPVFKVATATQQGVVCTMKSATGWGPRYSGKYTLKNGDEEILGRYDMDREYYTIPTCAASLSLFLSHAHTFILYSMRVAAS